MNTVRLLHPQLRLASVVWRFNKQPLKCKERTGVDTVILMWPLSLSQDNGR